MTLDINEGEVNYFSEPSHKGNGTEETAGSVSPFDATCGPMCPMFPSTVGKRKEGTWYKT